MSIILIFALLILGYYLWRWTYWRRRGIPGPLGIPFLGCLWQTLDHNYPPYLTIRDWTKKYGKIFGITEGPQVSLVVSDPELSHEIFVKQYDNFYGRKLNPLQTNDAKLSERADLFVSEGSRWKRMRTISSPTFSNNSLKKIQATVEDSALELLKHIEEHHEHEQIDLLQYYQEYTLDIIGRIAMGQNGTKIFNNQQLLESVRGIFGNDRWPLMMAAGVFPPIRRLFRSLLLTFPSFFGGSAIVSLIDTCQKAVDDRIEQRQASGEVNEEPIDFIDLFLDAHADDLEDDQNFQHSYTKVEKRLTKGEIVGQCLVFLVAGFDTTALALSYTSFLLATHRKAQDKVQKEIDEICTTPEVSFDQLSRLKYLDCVMKETLRLYPLGTMANTRKCMRETNLGGIDIPKGTDVLVDAWSIHYDESVWGPDAKEFKPERWENGDSFYPRGAYIPFGLGPRQCIGMRLAYMEEKLMLVHILRKYSFETGSKTQIPLKLMGRATTHPEDVYLHVKSRY